MAYVDFDLRKAVKSFGLIEADEVDLFSDVEPLEPSEFLRDRLQELAPVALGINTDQARRQFIISPILIEARRRSGVTMNVFPGAPFAVDEPKGLTGYCDYLIVLTSKIFYVESPVVSVVAAKKEDLVAGLGQCVAEMVAIQLFNERYERPLPVVYGSVTSGSIWRFLKLEGRSLSIDRPEYVLRDVARILGILVRLVRDASGRPPRA